MSNQPTANRIDQTPVRLSSNITIARQTPNLDFGQRLKATAENTGGAILNGATILGNAMGGPIGTGIASAAVNGITSMTSHSSPSAGGGAIAAQYGASGVVQLGGGTTTSTTIGSAGGSPGVSMGTTTSSMPNFAAGGGTGTTADMNMQLVQSQQENAQMMKLQMAMQRENLVFTSVSNVLKTRHDTSKNSIQNVR